MKIVTIVGARPQFIKIAAVSRKLRRQHQEVLIHTGQHYDYEMSGAFFDGLDLPCPDFNLGVGSGSHAAQTGAMLKGIEEILLAEKPQYLLTYGDTNSTLAGALAASKLSIPTIHIEAGLRSYNRAMPEEINRVVADHLAALLLCPSDTAVQNLAKEGITRNVHQVGDVMLDAIHWAIERTDGRAIELFDCLGLRPAQYVLATLHRSENTDNRCQFRAILEAFNALDEPVVFPVHPRARKIIDEIGFQPGPRLHLVDPLGYLEMVAMVASARLILTDSGGLQKEAYWLAKPCLTLRNETEWIETVQVGWNVLVGSDPKRILREVHSFVPPNARPPLYGDGKAADKCVELIGPKSEPLARAGKA